MSHIHNVVDTDPHYKINGITRTIVNVDETKRMLVQGDHNSERLTFEVPRFVDGHDFSECNAVEVHYVNEDAFQKNASRSFYIVEDLHIKGESEEDKNVVVLSWLVEGDATVYAGTLNFSIHFKCITNGRIDYSWNTTAFKGIMIEPAICNSQKIENEYPDAIAQLNARIGILEGNNDTLVLKDQNTENKYRVYVLDGKLMMTTAEESISFDSVFLKDENTGSKYKIYVFDGKLKMAAVNSESEV